MSAQVDVLDTMHDCAMRLRSKKCDLFAADLDEARDAVAALIAERDALREASTRLVDEVDGLVDESGGVYGLHLNGDPSPWDELLPGGQFERLTSLDDLRAALTTGESA